MPAKGLGIGSTYPGVNPEYPVLANYELLSEAHLEYVAPEGLSAKEINGFFQDPSASWRPYAAQMPWSRE